MYPFERFIRTLKDKVLNTAVVEGSICEVYLVEKTSTFASYYYPPNIPCRRTRVPQNDDGGEGCSTGSPSSIFNYPGRPSRKCTSCILEEREMKATHLYVLLNCPEVKPFLTFYPEGIVRGAITKIFKEKFKGAWAYWSEVNDNIRQTWFEDDKALYKWLQQDEDSIKKSFNSR